MGEGLSGDWGDYKENKKGRIQVSFENKRCDLSVRRRKGEGAK